MIISPEKKKEIQALMTRCNVVEDDLLEKFIKGSGRGGQKVNKTNSCVYLKHQPTGLEVKCQQYRSRETNRYIARRTLCELLLSQTSGVLSKKEKEIEKIQRRKKKKKQRQKRNDHT